MLDSDLGNIGAILSKIADRVYQMIYFAFDLPNTI